MQMQSLDQCIEKFEEAWTTGNPPELVRFVRDGAEFDTAVFVELVAIDLEHRWRRFGRDADETCRHTADKFASTPRLEDYVALFTDSISLPNLPLDLVAEEYRVRQRWGDRPTMDEFLIRFPNLRELPRELMRINNEVVREVGKVDGPKNEQTAFSDAVVSRMIERTGWMQGGERQTSPEVNEHSVTPALGTFAGYDLLVEIARGGMGVVYKARQHKPNRIVALKMILSGRLAGSEDVQRFYAEAEAAARLDHRGIVPVFEVGEQSGQHFFSMAFIEGQSLASRVSDGPLGCREAADLMREIADAIDYAHRHDIVHRDLKPANILVDPAGQPRVTDFGLARRTDIDRALTVSGQVMGTPSYMPPEQAAGRIGDTGPKSDIYSLGAILYFLLTTRPPIQGASILQTLEYVQTREPVPPRQLNPAIDRDLETICLKCLEKSPSRRYRTARELAEELERYLAGEPITARPVTRTERAWRWCRRNPWTTGLVGVSALAVLLLIAGSIYRQQSLHWQRTAELQTRLASEQAIIAQQQSELAQRNRELADLATAMQHFSRAGEIASRRQPGWSWAALEELSKARELGRDRLDAGRARSLTVECLSALDLRLAGIIKTDRYCRSLAFSPDSRFMALPEHMGTPTCAVHIHALIDQSRVRSYFISTVADNAASLLSAIAKGDFNPRFKEGFVAIAWSPDSRWLAAGTRQGRVYVWDRTEEQREPQVLDMVGRRTVGRLAFSPDSKTLYAATDVGDEDLSSWTLGETWQFGRLRSFVTTGFAIRPDGRQIVSRRGDLRVYETSSERQRTDFPDFPAGTINYSPDGRFVICGKGNELRVIDQESGVVRQLFRPADSTSVEFDVGCDAPQIVASRGLIIASGSDELVRLFDMATGRQIAAVSSGGRHRPPIAISPDGRWLGVGGEVSNILYELRDATLSRVTVLARLPIQDIALSADGKRLVYSCNHSNGNQVIRSEVGVVALDGTTPLQEWTTYSPEVGSDVESQPALVKATLAMHQVLGPVDLAATEKGEVGYFEKWRQRYVDLALSNLSMDELRTHIVRDHREFAVPQVMQRILGTNIDFEASDAYLGHWRNRLIASESLTYPKLDHEIRDGMRTSLQRKGHVLAGAINNPFGGIAGTVSMDRSGTKIAVNCGLLGLHWRSLDGRAKWPEQYASDGAVTHQVEERDFSIPERYPIPEFCTDPDATDGRAARWVCNQNQQGMRFRVNLAQPMPQSEGRAIAARIRVISEGIDRPWLRLGITGEVESLVAHGTSGQYEWRLVGVVPATMAAQQLDIRIAADPKLIRELFVDQIAVIPCAKYRDSGDYQVFVDGPHEFSPDGRRFWGVVEGESLVVWDTQQGTLAGRFNSRVMAKLSGSGGLRSLSVGRRWTTVGTASGHLLLLDTSEFKPSMQKVAGGEVTAVALNPAESLVASGTITGEIRLLRTSDLTTVADLNGHTNRIVSLAFTASGKQLWTASRDGLIQLWEDGEFGWQSILTLPDARVPIRSMKLALDGNRLAVLREGEAVVHIWNVNNL